MATEDFPTLLGQWRDGNADARDRLLELVYADLRRIAGKQFQLEKAGHTLQPTAIANEACLRLLEGAPLPARDRPHLMGLMARVVREVLINHARDRARLKRGGDAQVVRIELAHGIAVSESAPDLLDLDRALLKMQEADAVAAQVVEVKFFGGLTIDEISQSLDVSASTVERKWTWARAWLLRELRSR